MIDSVIYFFLINHFTTEKESTEILWENSNGKFELDHEKFIQKFYWKNVLFSPCSFIKSEKSKKKLIYS